MAWTAADIPDLTTTNAVVTGANGGLGLETAAALAGAGAHVVMAARNQAKAESARQEILAAHPDASLEIVQLDLGDLDSVRSASDIILAAHPALDLLVNNAGLMAMPEGRTVDGFETQLGVDHLGHYVLTALLLPALLRAPAARVVTVTSTARHIPGTLDADNPNMAGNYSAWKAYGQAKSANYHFALGLDRKFRAAGVAARSMAAHPGLSNTDLQANTVAAGGGGRLALGFHGLTARMGMSPEEGARPQLRAATDPDAAGGQLYGPRWVTNGRAVRLPVIHHPRLDRQIETMWTVSEHETGVRLDVPATHGFET